MFKIVSDLQFVVIEVFCCSNYNEQFFRKINFKIMGVFEEDRENIWELVKFFLKKIVKIEFVDYEMIVVYRILGVKGKIRLIIVKVLNMLVKFRIMRMWVIVKVKGGGFRLVDDVMKFNVEFIINFFKFEGIESVWYFNGVVYGKYKEKRICFDICDDIEEKLGKIK